MQAGYYFQGRSDFQGPFQTRFEESPITVACGHCWRTPLFFLPRELCFVAHCGKALQSILVWQRQESESRMQPDPVESYRIAYLYTATFISTQY
jgi:hypothetical protein